MYAQLPCFDDMCSLFLYYLNQLDDHPAHELATAIAIECTGMHSYNYNLQRQLLHMYLLLTHFVSGPYSTLLMIAMLA